MVEADVPSKTAGAGHEISDLNPKSIAFFAGALAAIIALAFVTVYVMSYLFLKTAIRSQTTPSPLSYTSEPAPESSLEVKPGRDLKTMRAEEDKILKSYAWIDKEKNIVRIPIDRAIDILVERGLPVRSGSGSTISAERQLQGPLPPQKSPKKVEK
jgi:hypothetical protein